MIKCIFILLLVLFFGCGVKRDTKIGMSARLQVCDIFNDTTEVVLGGEVNVLVFIKEPSCTGCKEYLAAFLNKLGKKYSQYIILEKSENVLLMKSYICYLDLRFKKSLGTYYSLSNNNISIKLDGNDYSFNMNESPFVVVVSKRRKSIDIYDYRKVFRNVFINDSFKISIQGY